MSKLGRPATIRPKAIAAVADNPGEKFAVIHAAVGGARRSLSSVLNRLVLDGVIFAASTSKHHRRYFPNQADALAWLDAIPQGEKYRLAWQRAYKKRMYALQHPPKPKVQKVAKSAAKVAEPKPKPTPVLRKSGSNVRTESPAPKRGPAYLPDPPGGPLRSPGFRYIVCPSPQVGLRTNTHSM